jgi:hypothetical protein
MSDATTMRPATKASFSPGVSFICGTVVQMSGWMKGERPRRTFWVLPGPPTILLPPRMPPRERDGDRGRCLDHWSNSSLVIAFH